MSDALRGRIKQARDAERTGVEALSGSAMKIYLINLDRDTERLAHMRKQLDGVAFERISAVDGSKDPPTTKGPYPFRTGLPGKPSGSRGVNS